MDEIDEDAKLLKEWSERVEAANAKVIRKERAFNEADDARKEAKTAFDSALQELRAAAGRLKKMREESLPLIDRPPAEGAFQLTAPPKALVEPTAVEEPSGDQLAAMQAREADVLLSVLKLSKAVAKRLKEASIETVGALRDRNAAGTLVPDVLSEKMGSAVLKALETWTAEVRSGCDPTGGELATSVVESTADPSKGEQPEDVPQAQAEADSLAWRMEPVQAASPSSRTLAVLRADGIATLGDLADAFAAGRADLLDIRRGVVESLWKSLDKLSGGAFRKPTEEQSAEPLAGYSPPEGESEPVAESA